MNRGQFDLVVAWKRANQRISLARLSASRSLVARSRLAVLYLSLLACFCTLRGVPLAHAVSGLNYRQRDAYWCCGLNCLAIVAHSHGIHANLSRIEGLLKPRANGECSVADLERAGRGLGLEPVSVFVDWNTLPSVPTPCIVQLRSPTRYATGSHYVILMGFHRNGVILLDAPNLARLHPYGEFRADFTGVVVAFPLDEGEKRDFIARFQNLTSWSERILGGATFIAFVVSAWLYRNRRWPGAENEFLAGPFNQSKTHRFQQELEPDNQPERANDVSTS